MQLQVHLKNEQFVVFDPTQTASSTQRSDTHLTAFFKANERYTFAQDLLYADFPSRFTWDRSAKSWRPRKAGNTFGRMVFVPPTAGEKYYARLILATTPGLRGFADMKTVNGVPYDTFRDACLARGLLADDREWRYTLDEGRYMRTGTGLRWLFLAIVLGCEPSCPLELWNEFKHDLCDDLPRSLARQGLSGVTQEAIYDYGLYLFQKRLLALDKSLPDVGLVDPNLDWTSVLRDHNSPTFSHDDLTRLLNENLPRLNANQRMVFEVVQEAIVQNTGNTFFVQGAAGSRKTFVYNTLYYSATLRSLPVLCVASSGLAALLLPNGKTAHSTLKIPITINEHSTCSISKTCRLADVLREARVLIWDKCSMQN